MLTPQELGLPEKFSSFYSTQYKLITELGTSEYSKTVVNAPTGSGKTLCNVAYPLMFGLRTLILTVTKNLQDQMHDDFDSITYNIKGHSNYSCSSIDNGGFECLAIDKKSCGYNLAIEASLSYNIVITSLAHWITVLKHGLSDRFGHFDAIVIDEAHRAHDTMTSQLATTVKLSDLSYYADIDYNPPSSNEFSIDKFLDLTREAISIVQHKVDLLSEEGDWSEAREKKALTRFLSKLKFIDRNVTSDNWIIEVSGFRSNREITVTPIWCREFANRFLFNGIERVILTSATVNEKTGSLLGLGTNSGSRKDFQYIEVPSTFDPKRRPFYYVPIVFNDAKIISGDLNRLYRTVDEWLSTRLNRNGTIHSVSYDRANDIVYASKYKDFMLSHRSDNAKSVIEKFLTSDSPHTLVSPIVKEGYDFKGDLCRHQIIIKVPYQYSGSPLNKARNKSDPTYMIYLAGQDIQQMVGRGMREENDWCESLIMDRHFGHFKDDYKFPKYFRKAFVNLSSIPRAMKPPNRR